MFAHAGIAAACVTGDTGAEDRAAALRALRERRINVVFTVDVFNEGVDLPDVDTVLFLRPTESATVFLQQFGRGLRRAPDKPVLTVWTSSATTAGSSGSTSVTARWSAGTGVK